MNVLETVNQSAFLALNAQPGTPDILLALARFCASGMIFIVPAILLGLWFLGGREGHRQALFCTLSILMALAMGYLCGSLWFHPRPFMMPLGHTWISHPADNGFPSDHGLVMFSAAFALLRCACAAWGCLSCSHRCRWPGHAFSSGSISRWIWWGRRRSRRRLGEQRGLAGLWTGNGADV
jgi:membrane-associated phospholipid phosphatase